MIAVEPTKTLIKIGTSEGLPFFLATAFGIFGAGFCLLCCPPASFAIPPLLGLLGWALGAVIRKRQLCEDMRIENGICVRVNEMIAKRDYSALSRALDLLMENKFNGELIQKVAYGIALAFVGDSGNLGAQDLFKRANGIANGEVPKKIAKPSRTLAGVLGEFDGIRSSESTPEITRHAPSSRPHMPLVHARGACIGR